jgi:hypothetical protein
MIAMDAVSESVRREVPWDMFYADDLTVAADTAQILRTRFLKWPEAIESKGLKINTSKINHGVL